MRCVILQPSYIPWRGYFDLIRRADLFVFYDDVQYDQRGWRNRNRIKTRHGLQWLTIPVQSSIIRWGDTASNDVLIAYEQDWRNAHLEALRHSYTRTPYYLRYKDMLSRWYAMRPSRLVDFTIETTIELASELGVAHTRFVRSSAFGCSGAKTDRLLALLQKVGATEYLSGPSARDYLDVPLLEAEGIRVEWITYDYPEYPQLFPPFEAQASILDLLLNVGPVAPKYIWGD